MYAAGGALVKRRALLQGLTAGVLIATPAMRALALVRDFGVPPFNVWSLYETQHEFNMMRTASITLHVVVNPVVFDNLRSPEGAVARILLEETTQ